MLIVPCSEMILILTDFHWHIHISYVVHHVWYVLQQISTGGNWSSFTFLGLLTPPLHQHSKSQSCICRIEIKETEHFCRRLRPYGMEIFKKKLFWYTAENCCSTYVFGMSTADSNRQSANKRGVLQQKSAVVQHVDEKLQTDNSPGKGVLILG